MSLLSRFAVFRNPSRQLKRTQESRQIMPLLIALEKFVTLDDVEFGHDPPDFVLRHQHGAIGVELTDLVPKAFHRGGYYQRSKFKVWQRKAKECPMPKDTYEWGEFTLKDSLSAFSIQFDNKVQKARKWNESFSEKWLLMHVASGSPFGELVMTKHINTPGSGAELSDYFAKVKHAVFSICQRSRVFDYIILFSQREMLSFSSNGSNHYKLPTPSADELARGERASDKFLDWRSKIATIVEHPLLSPKERLS